MLIVLILLRICSILNHFWLTTSGTHTLPLWEHYCTILGTLLYHYGNTTVPILEHYCYRNLTTQFGSLNLQCSFKGSKK